MTLATTIGNGNFPQVSFYFQNAPEWNTGALCVWSPFPGNLSCVRDFPLELFLTIIIDVIWGLIRSWRRPKETSNLCTRTMHARFWREPKRRDRDSRRRSLEAHRRDCRSPYSPRVSPNFFGSSGPTRTKLGNEFRRSINCIALCTDWNLNLSVEFKVGTVGAVICRCKSAIRAFIIRVCFFDETMAKNAEAPAEEQQKALPACSLFPVHTIPSGTFYFLFEYNLHLHYSKRLLLLPVEYFHS